MRTRTTARKLLLLTAPALLAVWVALELVFRFVVPAAEKPPLVFDETHAMLRSDAGSRTSGVYTMGRLARVRARWRTNNFGWNSAIDYEVGAGHRTDLTCVIGDSYVRALQVDVGANLAARLRRRLPEGHQVYGIGHDGAPLSQYLHMSRYAVELFAPDTLVFVLVHNDFDESIREIAPLPHFLQVSIRSGEIVEVPPRPVPLHSWLRRSAVLRYLYSNARIGSLYFGWDRGRYHANVDADAVAARKSLVTAATRHLMRTIAQENPGRRLLFVMDAPRPDVYTEALETSRVLWINYMVRDLCAELGLECVDLTPVFAQQYRLRGRRFESDVDDHWNERGHRLVSEVVHRRLRETRR